MGDHGSKLVARGLSQYKDKNNKGIHIPGKDSLYTAMGPSDPDQHFSDHCDLPNETLPSEYSGNILGCPSEN